MIKCDLDRNNSSEMDKIYTPSAVFDSSGKLAGITLSGSSESSKSSHFSLKLVDLLVDFLFLKLGIREDGFWGFFFPPLFCIFL